MKVGIIDYGYGNLFSLEKALAHLGVRAVTLKTPKAIRGMSALIVPGVGAFGEGIKELRKRGFEKPILSHANVGKQLLGICLGMQFLFDYSEEFGTHKGLGLIQGKVGRISPKKGFKVPHIGWNEMQLPRGRKNWKSTILDGISVGKHVYFVHSYAGTPKERKDIVAEAEYGGSRIVAAVQRGTLFGTQFHPEKSGEIGLSILKNFLKNA